MNTQRILGIKPLFSALTKICHDFTMSVESSGTPVKTSQFLSRGKYELKSNDTRIPENFSELQV